MTGDDKERKKRDPIFTTCFVIFLLAAVGVVGVFINDHYISEDDTKAAYGDKVTVNYTGAFYDFVGEENAVVFDTSYSSVADNDKIVKSNEFTSKGGKVLSLTIGKGEALKMFEDAIVGHKVGDKFEVMIPNGYEAATSPIDASTKGEMSVVQEMTKAAFDVMYKDYKLTAGVWKTITTIYGWEASVFYDTTDNSVTINNMPVAGETYTYCGPGEGKFGKIELKINSVGANISFDYVFSDYKAVNGTQIQMMQFYIDGQRVYITHVSDNSFTYKTCSEKDGEDLYFEIELVSIG